jgi:DNA-binding IclR family transcriptional regulator
LSSGAVGVDHAGPLSGTVVPVEHEHVQVIDRSIDLLETLSEGPRSLTEVCRVTGLSKGTAFRLLAGLIARGMVMKDPVGSTYMLGPALFGLVQGALSGIGAIATVGRTALRELSEATGETVALHVQSGLERLNVEEVPSRHSIRYSSLASGVAPVHNASVGLVLLAFSPEERCERTLDLLEASGEAFDRGTVEARLRKTRRDGHAISVGERVPGATAISVPVQSHHLLLALSVLGPEQRLPVARLKSFLAGMRRTADRLVAVLDQQAPLPIEEAS